MNVVILSGRLTSNVELKQGANITVGNFSLAVDRGKDKDGTDKGTDFPRCVVFGKTAENLAKYQGKGSHILIEGHLQTGSYTKKDGTKVYTTDVIANRVEFLGSKQERMTQESPTHPANRDAGIPEGFHEYSDEDEDVPF